jgi:hypothetical protein
MGIGMLCPSAAHIRTSWRSWWDLTDYNDDDSQLWRRQMPGFGSLCRITSPSCFPPYSNDRIRLSTVQ